MKHNKKKVFKKVIKYNAASLLSLNTDIKDLKLNKPIKETLWHLYDPEIFHLSPIFDSIKDIRNYIRYSDNSFRYLVKETRITKYEVLNKEDAAVLMRKDELGRSMSQKEECEFRKYYRSTIKKLNEYLSKINNQENV